MWHNHPFNQRKKDNKKSSECGGWRQQGRWSGWFGQNLKKRGINIGGGGCIHKIGELGNLCQLRTVSQRCLW